MKLTIDNDKIGYIRLPNGVILQTVSGVINTIYTGIAGRINYYVPKIITTDINISSASNYGDAIYNGSSSIILSHNNYTSLKANNVVDYVTCEDNANLS